MALYYFTARTEDIIIYRIGELLNNTVSAIAMVTLVIVTMFYARQTEKQAQYLRMSLEENKKKRTVDFWERRIAEFYKPYLDKLNRMKLETSKYPIDRTEINTIINNTRDFYWQKGHLVSEETYQQMIKLQDLLIQIMLDKQEEHLDEFRSAETKMREKIEKERKNDENEIREFYGYKDIEEKG